MFVGIPRTTEFDCAIVLARYITFTFPNPLSQDHHSASQFSTLHLHLPPESPPCEYPYHSILNPTGFSPLSPTISSFSSPPPHPHHLLRLILIGNPPTHSTPPRIFPHPLLLVLTPKSAFYQKGICNSEFLENPFLIYGDEVRKCKILEICEGPYAGEMLIKNVVVETTTKEFRRRLRFKRMPNLVQTHMRILPKNELNYGKLDNLEFVIDNSVLVLLVHPYLSHMVVCQSKRKNDRGRYNNPLELISLCTSLSRPIFALSRFITNGNVKRVWRLLCKNQISINSEGQAMEH
ncbi:unnamed protein product [Fraxinus pennsylvanica]|uniref:Uncharacterized protein n=1 Tax=Fraxinus pennsylvanica TaxID=56036 RepID=A0AAD1YZU8_9LAMI|nr:unnamed protein product [Fraxinus pennsylvanica]